MGSKIDLIPRVLWNNEDVDVNNNNNKDDGNGGLYQIMNPKN